MRRVALLHGVPAPLHVVAVDSGVQGVAGLFRPAPQLDAVAAGAAHVERPIAAGDVPLPHLALVPGAVAGLVAQVVGGKPHRLRGAADHHRHVAPELLGDQLPPLLVAAAQLRHQRGMIGGNVAPLARIPSQVVQLQPVHQAPRAAHHRAQAPLGRVGDALRVGHHGALGPGAVIHAAQQRRQAAAVE